MASSFKLKLGERLFEEFKKQYNRKKIDGLPGISSFGLEIFG